MNRASKLIGLIALVIALSAMATASASAHKKHDNSFTTAVIGDTPYGAAQNANFPNDIAAINADPNVGMVIHLGDIKNGSSQCTDTYFQSIRSSFDTFADPLVYTPGDNEWTDCHRASNGNYNPLERLQKLRQVFFDRPGVTLGQNRTFVRSQQWRGFPENVRWRRNDIQFGVINLPGSNDDLVPWTGAWGDGLTVGPVQQGEHDSRLAANLDWIDGVFSRAARHRTRAVVIGLQADMFDPEAAAANQVSAYAPIIHKIATRAAAYRKPVLLLNGDSHIFEADHPFAAGQQASTIYGETAVAPNVTRVTVNGSTTAPHEWLKLRFDPGSAGVFSWTRVPFAIQP
ncbi:MAG: metallophosphoesterase [Thermoleophilaceae bacterium]|nr:metallophosphoesterase [Thermoleophilaceae bacterium]